MMFKEKSFGAAPPFLQLDDSESETEKEDRPNNATDDSLLEKIKTEISTGNSVENSLQGASEATSIDTTCMNSNSGEHVQIKSESKKCIEDGASDISSDDEVLESCTPPKATAGDVKLDDDKMSLSSLSSTEDKVNRKSMAPDMALHKAAAQHVGETYYYPGSANPYYYPGGESTAYDPYSAQYMNTHGYMQPYMPGFPTLIPGGYVQSEYPIKKSDQITPASEPKKDPSDRIVTAVIERVKTELKQILKKDINKRMIESIAYRKYDSWWDEQVQNKNKTVTTTV